LALAGALAACAPLAVAGTLLAGGASAAACGGFENPCSNETSQQFGYGSVQRQDTPNDPNYDQSEPDTQQPPTNRSSNFYDERFDCWARVARTSHRPRAHRARERPHENVPPSSPPATSTGRVGMSRHGSYPWKAGGNPGQTSIVASEIEIQL
jgi:hypothetical protein